MKTVKVVKVTSDFIQFDNGITLDSSHEEACCEDHYLSFSDVKLEDFDGLEFDLSNDNFFERVNGYGIRLLPANGHPIGIAGYGNNNGNYSADLTLVLSDGRTFDITECQVIND